MSVNLFALQRQKAKLLELLGRHSRRYSQPGAAENKIRRRRRRNQLAKASRRQNR